MSLTAAEILPEDADRALLIGRVWSQAEGGPCPVLVRGGRLRDVSALAPTVSGVLELPNLPAVLADGAGFPDLGSLDAYLSGAAGQLLAPVDLQAVKAAGVTFADSMLERVIEEQAKGDPARAQEIRIRLAPILGDNLRGLVAGSERAAEVKAALQDLGLWSQYLEVGIGPDAEVFTKAPPMAAVGCGAGIGVHRASAWNNPEPEVVLAVNSTGRICGATLGNDVNLRDVEGRSALLLGKAKDNNASAAVGPFIRLFDGGFGLETVEGLRVGLEIVGEDGFLLADHSDMGQISRPPASIVAQTLNASHQYPDGFVLYLGTMFAPTKDRDAPGQGFTHHWGDRVTISSGPLGRLVNTVEACDALPAWSFGTRALMENLARRGVL